MVWNLWALEKFLGPLWLIITEVQTVTDGYYLPQGKLSNQRILNKQQGILG